MTDFAVARRNMVDGQLRTFDVRDRAVLTAMEEVPREAFVPEGREALAYLDQNLALPGSGEEDDPRTMLAPMVLARLIQALAIEPGSTVLDVGGGLGYSAAVLARLGAEVTLLESRSDLAEAAGQRLAASGLRVRQANGPLSAGVSGQAPFDAILVNGAIEEHPTDLLKQLDDGGRLACLRAEGRSCKAMLFGRSGAAVGFRTLFDATAPVLAAFRRAPAFVFGT